MIVRSARGPDWTKLLELIREGHARSNIASYALDEKFAKELFLTLMLANMRHPVHDGACVFVADLDGRLEGFIIPAANRLCVLGRDLIVSDLMFYCREGADARAAGMLWNALECWASVPEVVAVRPSITNAVGDPERVAKFYEARGYERIGIFLEKRRAAQAARRVA